MSSPTLDEITTLASKTIADGGSLAAMKMARWIMDNLAEAAPCGFEMPEPFVFGSDGRPGVAFGEDTMLSEDARAVGRGFFAAADEAERLAAAKKGAR